MLGVVDFDSIGRSFRESFFMLWETLWALILGFLLSGIVQSFVSKTQILRKLGDHRPPAIARASLYGMASSSCSYAASAMAKSLFQKGADFVSATVFMVASTNLVVELGLVLFALIGWQFLGAEFAGGIIMIGLLALLGGFFLRGARIDHARDDLSVRDASSRYLRESSATPERDTFDDDSLSARLHSSESWTHAASFAVGDATMLRRELVFGFLAAGFLSVLIPANVWSHLYFEGHGGWTTLENVCVGPIIAFLSCVCSVGNIPLAAALWHGGINFSGVIAFVFADLVAAPLVLVYRKFYGTAVAIRLVVVLYIAMVAAALIIGELFSLSHIVPHARAIEIAPTRFAWDSTTFLNIVFLALAAGAYWLYRQGRAGLRTLAVDPVCGMHVRRRDAPSTVRATNTTYFFCSDHCSERFREDPSRYVDTKKSVDTSH